MAVVQTQTLSIRASEDLLYVRQAVRAAAVNFGFTLVDQSKLVTAASELARNTVTHGGGGGEVSIEVVHDGQRVGICLMFEDHGPGIPDVQRAMKDGYTTIGGLGLGLGGAKRLSNEFEIVSRPSEGTRVRIVRWRSEL